MNEEWKIYKDTSYHPNGGLYEISNLGRIKKNNYLIKGYYNYKTDGFGPVCDDYESTIDEIIKILDNDCKNDPIYEKRIDKFFKYNDKNNCKRNYDEIMKL